MILETLKYENETKNNGVLFYFARKNSFTPKHTILIKFARVLSEIVKIDSGEDEPKSTSPSDLCRSLSLFCSETHTYTFCSLALSMMRLTDFAVLQM